tara:strand:- start:64 stop:678 length:615 start_codon:yes stop_codon:yes gene_type:complete
MKIRPVIPNTYGWLETKLPKKAMEHLWDCIETARGERWNKHLVGHIEKSFKIEDKGDWFWNNIIKKHIEAYFNEFNAGHTKIPLNGKYEPYLDTLWVNYQNQHEFNPFHNHGGLYSFAIWMKIPTSYDEQNELDNAKELNDARNSAFLFQFTDTLGQITNYVYKMNPEYEGTMVFFPASLQHGVHPFYNCDDQRISIAGNVALR